MEDEFKEENIVVRRKLLIKLLENRIIVSAHAHFL